MNEREAAVAADPDLVASIQRGVQQAHEGRTTSRSFAAYLTDED